MIYFVRAGGTDFVKIGYTADQASLKIRLLALQTGQPWRLEVLRVIEGDQHMEWALHQMFAEHRCSGEWFTYTPTMMHLLPGDAPGLRAYLKGKPRKVLEDLIERLIGLLDDCSPDADAEPEMDDEIEADDEPDADQSIFIERGHTPDPTRYDFSAEEDAELSLVLINAQ